MPPSAEPRPRGCDHPRGRRILIAGHSDARLRTLFEPEFLDRERESWSAPSEYFDGFGIKLAILGWGALAILGVAALGFGWNFHQYAIGVALGGGALIGTSMVLTMGNQSFSNYGMIIRTGYGLNSPRLPVDAWARRVSVLLLVAGPLPRRHRHRAHRRLGLARRVLAASECEQGLSRYQAHH